MDGKGFDELTRRLATQRSRRSVLRGLVGGGAALAAMRAGTTVNAASKVNICHWSPDLGYYELISVSENAVPAHQAHHHGLDIIGPDFNSIATCGDCNIACYDVDPCTPAACSGRVCNQTPTCSGYQTCGGGGIAGDCGCTPTFTAESCDGVTCGDIPDGCGGYVTCGCSTSFQTCGGGGVSGQCGCTPTFTADNCDGVTCGEIENGCGGYVTCGCADGYFCGESGCEAIVPRCTNVWLAGYPENSTPGGVCADDFLDIYVNEQFVTTVVVGGCKPPVPLGALQNGDTIYVELRDNLPPCTVEPFRLICGDTGAALQDLNPVGHCSGPVCGNGSDGWGGSAICYSESFTVNF